MENAAELPENTGMNEHAIKLEKGKQPPFGPIYSPGPVELETLKIYIKTNLANGFIRPSKSPTGAPTLQSEARWKLPPLRELLGLNNIIMKNRYPLLFIGEFFNQLGRAK